MARRFDGRSIWSKASDATLIGLGLLLLLPPLLAIFVSGATALQPSAALAQATLTSLLLGSLSAALAFALAWPLASLAARSRHWRRWSGLCVLASWIVPPAVLATGWFIAFIAHAGSTYLAAFLVIAMNALMAFAWGCSFGSVGALVCLAFLSGKR